MILTLLFLLSLVHADTKDTDTKMPLKWGADSEGGVPFVFQDPKNPERITGFEVDLMEAIARHLKRKPEQVQNAWDSLIPGLNRGDYEIAVNGIEITEDRKEKVLFSDPYFITSQMIAVQATNTDIFKFSDLVGRSVGTLKQSLAHRMLEAKGGIDIRPYESEMNAYQDLDNGRIDAVFLDAPIAIFQGRPNPKIKVLPEEIGRMSYGVALKKSDTVLAEQINTVLSEMKKSGELREIYDSWNLWNKQMENAFGPGQKQVAANTKHSQYDAYLAAKGLNRTWKDLVLQYFRYLPMLLKGAKVTLSLSMISMCLAVALGLMLTLVSLYCPNPFSFLARSYIEVVRGTPLLIQLYFIFYGLPNIGIRIEPFWAAVLGLGLNYAAYEAENYRAGLQSISKGQFEASRALGLSEAQTLWHVILPQSMRLVIPPVTNDFISLLKDSSLVSVITMVELTKIYGQLATTYYDYFGLGLLVAAFYFLIGLPFVRLARYLEVKFTPRLASGFRK